MIFLLFGKKTAKLMLGGISFVNSSCLPNCAYVPDLKHNFMEIVVTAKKGISSGQEVTVFYGGEFFGENRVECQCPFVEYHGPGVRLYDSWTRSGRQRFLPRIPSVVPTSELSSEPADVAVDASVAVFSKRRKFVTKFRKPRASKFCRRRRTGLITSSSDSAESSGTTESSEEDSEPRIVGLPTITVLENNCEAPLNTHSLDEEEVQVFCASTPVHTPCCQDFEEFLPIVPDLSDDDSSSPVCSESSDELCKDSKISAASFSNRILELNSAYRFSDRALRDIIKLFQDALPHCNNVPSFHEIQNIANQYSDQIKKIDFPEGVAFYFDIKSQLEHVLNQNIDTLRRVDNWNPCDDIRLPNCAGKVIHLILNADGVSPFKSSKFELYPIWLMVANFPASRRVKFKNMMLGALYGGSKKPCYQTFFKPFCEDMKHLERGFDLTIVNRDVKVIFSFFYFIKFLQNNSYKLILIL